MNLAHGTARFPAVTGVDGAAAHAAALAALQMAGYSPAEVVQVVEYVTDGPTPAHPFGEVTVTTVPVEGLLQGGAAVEVTAYRDEGGEATAVPGERGAVGQATASGSGGGAVGQATAVRGGDGASVEAVGGGAGAGRGGGIERIGTPYGIVTVADEIVYLPGIVPGELAAGFGEQYRSCLEVAGELLASAGVGLEALVRTTDYTASGTRADYPRCGRPRRELLGGSGVHPGAAGILVDRPVVAGAMVTLDAVGSRRPLRVVNPGWRRYETLTYVPGVAAGNTLFMSGFGALEPATQRAIFEGELLAQAEYTYAAICAVLREAGLDGGAVVRLVEYVTPQGVGKYPDLEALRARYFPGRVALTSVVCSALLRPEFLIEVVPTAVFP